MIKMQQGIGLHPPSLSCFCTLRPSTLLSAFTLYSLNTHSPSFLLIGHIKPPQHTLSLSVSPSFSLSVCLSPPLFPPPPSLSLSLRVREGCSSSHPCFLLTLLLRKCDPGGFMNDLISAMQTTPCTPRHRHRSGFERDYLPACAHTSVRVSA